jgi:hypothetical protein
VIVGKPVSDGCFGTVRVGFSRKSSIITKRRGSGFGMYHDKTVYRVMSILLLKEIRLVEGEQDVKSG